MYLSHAIAVALTYFIARYFEKIAIAVETLIAAVLPRVSFKIFILKFQQFFVCVYFQDKTLISILLHSCKKQCFQFLQGFNHQQKAVKF
jgi:hypothetical protein